MNERKRGFNKPLDFSSSKQDPFSLGEKSAKWYIFFGKLLFERMEEVRNQTIVRDKGSFMQDSLTLADSGLKLFETQSELNHTRMKNKIDDKSILESSVKWNINQY